MVAGLAQPVAVGACLEAQRYGLARTDLPTDELADTTGERNQQKTYLDLVMTLIIVVIGLARRPKFMCANNFWAVLSDL